MKFKLTLLAAALAVAACAPKSGPTTKVVGQFTEDAPAVVDLSISGVLDTTIVVTDGRFEAVIPTAVATMTTIRASGSAALAPSARFLRALRLVEMTGLLSPSPQPSTR